MNRCQHYLLDCFSPANLPVVYHHSSPIRPEEVRELMNSGQNRIDPVPQEESPFRKVWWVVDQQVRVEGFSDAFRAEKQSEWAAARETAIWCLWGVGVCTVLSVAAGIGLGIAGAPPLAIVA